MNYNIQSRRQSSLILSVKFWTLTILLVLLYTAIIFAQTTVYIDPTNSGDPGQDGTIDHPWDSWTDISIQNNTVYKQMRGTSETLATHVNIDNKDNVKITTYGDGERPYLYQGTANTHIFRVNNSSHIEIEGFKLEMPIGAGGGVISISAHGAGNSAYYNYVRDCEIIGGWRGIDSEVFKLEFDTEIGNLYIYDCHIYNQTSDGIFCKTNQQSTYDTIVISRCNIHDVNLKWHTNQEDADGDPVHLLRCDNFLVEYNILDRRSTAKKFCFIWGGGVFGTEKGVVRYNTMYPPYQHPNASSNAIFITQGLDSLQLYGNKIIGRGYEPGQTAGATGLIRATYVNMSYNLVDNVGGIGVSHLYCDYADINNNTINFLDLGWGYLFGLGGDVVNMRNNIFMLPVGSNLTSINGGITYQENNIELHSDDLQGFDDVLHFVDIDNYNYHLTENSLLARNQGSEYFGALDCDADTVPVPLELVRDIGVFEYDDGNTQTNSPPQIVDQSFNIDENSSNGAIVGTVLATDPDAGQTITFSIEGGNASNAFQINSSSGVLTVNNSSALDFETTPIFSLMVMVEDNGIGTLTDQATITVTLIDVNENPNIEDQSFNISENSPPGAQVGSVIATDPDNGQSLTYTIISGNVDDTFVLESSSGLLSLSSTAVLDFNVTPVYNLAVEVEDDGTGNLSSQAMITVNVISTNEPPVIEEQTFYLDENSTSGFVVGTIEATDPDNGQTLIFSILSGNTDNAFSVDPNTGELMVDNSSAIDFETNPLYSLVVEVEDNGPGNLTSQAVITINLNDLNEDPNIEDQIFSVYENSPNGYELGTVIATDPDNGQALTYTIISGNNNNAFSVGVNTGRLIVGNSSAINFEVISEFTLVVEVEDNGSGNLSDQATITITVNDMNEPPVIAPQNFSIDENSPNSSQIGTVLATDPDNGQTLVYSIVSGNMGNAFDIDDNSGVLSVSNSTVLNFEVFPIFVLTVEVEDNGTGNLSSSAQITVNLTDVNEPPIIIPEQNFVVDVESSLIEHEINGLEFDVGLVSASDPDAGQSVTFSIITGNEKNIWSINANSGEIKLINPYYFNPYEINNYPLIIEVADNSPEQLTTSAEVMINVNIYTNNPLTEENATTSVDNISELEYSIYPNPARTYLKFDLENINTDHVSITITNLNGETVFQRDYSENNDRLSKQIDLNGFSQGMYIIYFHNGSMMKYDKFIKL